MKRQSVKVPLLALKAQYAALREELRPAIDAVCEAQQFILGARVEAFEKRAAEYCGTKHAIGVSSGSDALLAALTALGVGPGDAVVLTPYTFFATAGAVARLGARAVFADIDPQTFNLDPAAVRTVMQSFSGRFKELQPRVLMPVHLFGQCADMDPLLETARQYDLKVIEDAAQAIGAEYPSQAGVRRAGSMGDLGCFSFFPSKNLGAFGDGGMVTTDDDALAERVRCLRNHGAAPKYHHKLVGGNFRLDALQAAVLEVKLGHLEAWHAARRRNADRYRAAFEGSGVGTPAAVYADRGIENHHVYNQYVVRVPRRDAVREALLAAGIGHEVYYPLPLHLQECFRDLGYAEGDFPESERAARETIALPVYPELTAEMQETVAAEVLKACA